MAVFLKLQIMTEISNLLLFAWEASLADVGFFWVGNHFKRTDKPLTGNSAAAEFVAIREF